MFCVANGWITALNTGGLPPFLMRRFENDPEAADTGSDISPPDDAKTPLSRRGS
jgi:hypothetical protein